MDYLDHNGQVQNCKYGWASFVITYDEQGHPVCVWYENADGSPVNGPDGDCKTEYYYDTNHNISSFAVFDPSNRSCNNKYAYSKAVNTYDKYGLLQSRSFFSADGTPTYSNGIHQTCFTYDALGRQISHRYCNADGTAACDPKTGLHEVRYILDKQGRLSKEVYLDTIGSPACNKQTGAYGIALFYDNNGHQSELHLLDEMGMPSVGKSGYAFKLTQYDSSGHLVQSQWLDETGSPVRITDGVAKEASQYDVFGNLTESRYYDEQNQLCYHRDDFAIVKRAYENGLLVSERYFDPYEQPIVSPNLGHEVRWEYDEAGNATVVANYDANGIPFITTASYASSVRTYDQYGNILSEQYLDKAGAPCFDINGIAANQYTYDAAGNLIRHQITCVTDSMGYDTVEYEYDDFSRCIATRYYLEGVLTQQLQKIYDDRGLLLQERQLTGNGQPAQDVAYNESQYIYNQQGLKTSAQFLLLDPSGRVAFRWQELYIYDDRGNCTETSYLDQNGAPLCCNDGWAVRKDTFSPEGYVSSREYYDDQGHPVSVNGAFRTEHKYTATGSETECLRFDTDGTHPACAKTVYEYNSLGLRSRTTHYDADGQLCATPDGPVAITERTYDVMGYPTKDSYYDKDGELLYQQQEISCLTEIYYDTALEAGLQPGDLLLRWNDWEYFDPDADSIFFGLLCKMRETIDLEKDLVICRQEEDGTYTFHRVSLPTGPIGVRIETAFATVQEADVIRVAYAEWAKTHS